MKKGLVLQGGAMRGIYTAGVIDVLLENGIGFDGVIGVSAGAVHGVNFVSGQAGRSIRYFLKYCDDNRFMSMRSLLTTGDFFGADFCYREIPQQLDVFDTQAFMQSNIEFYVVCTDIDTGTPYYRKCTSLCGEEADILRASASMPLASRVVFADGKHLLDGGMTDDIPVGYFRSLGYNKILAVLTREKSYRRNKNSTLPFELRYGKSYPAVVECMRKRPESYNAEVEKIEADEQAGNIFVIRPSKDLGLGRAESNKSKLYSQYLLGRDDTLSSLESLVSYLEK